MPSLVSSVQTSIHHTHLHRSGERPSVVALSESYSCLAHFLALLRSKVIGLEFQICRGADQKCLSCEFLEGLGRLGYLGAAPGA